MAIGYDLAFTERVRLVRLLFMKSDITLAQRSHFLDLLDSGRKALAEAKTIKEVKEIRDKSAGAEFYLRQRGGCLDIQLDAAELKVRAERELGKILRETVNHKGSKGVGIKTLPTLPDGVTKLQSSRWQKVESVPEKKFEQLIVAARAPEKEATLSTASLLRLSKEQSRESKRKTNRAMVQGTAAPADAIPDQYQTLVVDPPWDWADEGDQDQLGRARPTYHTMTLAEITALPVGDLSQKNSHLYLWITNRSLPKGFALLEAWGFRYVTCLTWCKPSFGMGNYFRGSTEQILFGVKGSLSLLRSDVGTWFQAARPPKRGHSSKPDEFYELVETCSPGPWLELFARKPRTGWVSWGAEV